MQRLLLASAVLCALLQLAGAGGVGECKTECVERNKEKIVRVHLKDDYVMVGTCRNATEDELAKAKAEGNDDVKSIVTPYTCNRNVGIWTIDELDEEGIVEFTVQCPQVFEVTDKELEKCPK